MTSDRQRHARHPAAVRCFSQLTLLALLLLPGSSSADPVLGDRAPATTLQDAHARSISLASIPGTVMVVDFFATWCGPCHDAIAALSEELRDIGAHMRLVIVDEGEDPSVVEPWFAAHPLPAGAVVVYDRDGSASRAWGQHRYPTTYFVDDHGVIRHINRGYGPGYPMRTRGWITAMLAN